MPDVLLLGGVQLAPFSSSTGRALWHSSGDVLCEPLSKCFFFGKVLGSRPATAREILSLSSGKNSREAAWSCVLYGAARQPWDGIGCSFTDVLDAGDDMASVKDLLDAISSPWDVVEWGTVSGIEEQDMGTDWMDFLWGSFSVLEFVLSPDGG